MRSDIYSWCAPDMPPPGNGFSTLADRMCKSKPERKDELLDMLYRKATFSSGNLVLSLPRDAERVSQLRIVGGHLWGAKAATGPTGPAKVMFVGKMLSADDIAARRHFSGKYASFLLEVLGELGASGDQLSSIYVTSVLKCGHYVPDSQGGAVKVAWLADWRPVLEQELRLIRPDLVVCFGADAAREVLRAGRQTALRALVGQLWTRNICLRNSEDDPEDLLHTAKVYVCRSPAEVWDDADLEPQFRSDLRKVLLLLEGKSKEAGLAKETVDHRYVRDFDEAMDLIKEIDRTCQNNLIAFDAEWHGAHPQNDGWYLRSVQLSWRHKTAAYFAISDPGGDPVYSPGQLKKLFSAMRKMLSTKMLAAHYGVSDLEFLTAAGLDLREFYFNVLDTWQEYRNAVRNKQPCGLDTAYLAHARRETAAFDLTSQLLNYTDVPRYDTDLLEWKANRNEDDEGYGDTPDDILVPYGNYDADGARRLAIAHLKGMDRDEYGNSCWNLAWMTMRLLPTIYEMNTTGLMVDRERAVELHDLYSTFFWELVQQVRDWAEWPEWNPNSVFHVRELMFGEKLNGHVPAKRIRPDGAKSLKLTPYKTTDKYLRLWEELDEEIVEDKSASADRMSAAVLYHRAVSELGEAHETTRILSLIRSVKFIGHILRYSLTPPEDCGDGVVTWGKGLLSHICDDGALRSHVYPTKETRRWSLARPSLQNLTKRRERDYARILGDKYKYPLRSIFTARPGFVFVESDYIGAELFTMAVQSGDATMIEHALRNQLPEDHPDYYDIHSSVTVLAFRLDCQPTKAGLRSIGKLYLRDICKAVVFGIAYGRSDPAIVAQALEEGIPTTVEEARNLRETLFDLYKLLPVFFQSSQARVIEPGFLVDAMGGIRRFPKFRDKTDLRKMQREAMNAPVQGMVANVVGRAVDYMAAIRDEVRPGAFRMVLQVHDAIFSEVKCDSVEWYTTELLPECMVRRNPIYPCNLDGERNVELGGPYYLGIDISIGKRLGESLDVGGLLSRGISPRAAGWEEYSGGWRKPYASQYWKDGKMVSV